MGYFFSQGIRHQYSTGTSNRRQAETIEAKLKEEVNNRRFQIVQPNPDMRFDELAARFLASGSVRPHHVYHLKILFPYFSGTPILRITKSMTEEFRKARRLRNKSIKDATVNRDRASCGTSSIGPWTSSCWRQTRWHVSGWPRERRTKRQVLSVAEEQALLAAANDHLLVMITLALDTGMRRGEITSQRWDDIDFSRNLLSVTHSKTPEGESREIPLTKRLRDLLLPDRRMTGLVVDYCGRPVHTVKRAWKTALKNGCLRHVRFHDLRHTFNTRLMEAGVLQEIRMALMGHSSGKSVHSIYTHIELPVMREAIGKLETWVKQQREQIQKQKEQEHDRPESTGTEAGSGQEAGQPQAVEKEVTG